MTLETCLHKRPSEFYEQLPSGRLRWTCTKCGQKGLWCDGWEWFGRIECKSCGCENIESVRCSACSDGDDKPSEAARAGVDGQRRRPRG